DQEKLSTLQKICEKFHVPYSVIGRVTGDSMMEVKVEQETIARLPSEVVANAPLLDRPTSKPKYLESMELTKKPSTPKNLYEVLLKMLANPNIASKHWVYTQYDHEVGIRTIIKPGRDASVLRLDNGKLMSINIDEDSNYYYDKT